ncbi:MAG: efflux RND transporter periplasmic adaptor subunit [bacterium]
MVALAVFLGALGAGGPARALPVRPAVASAADWCGEHRVPESMCPKCNPGLEAQYRAAGDWCGAHGFPESVCPLCHPLAPPGGPAADDGHGHGPGGAREGGTPRVADRFDWCVEHGLPESQCPKCDPALEAKQKASGDWCPEHGFPESVCPYCNPIPPPPGVPGPSAVPPGTRIRLRDPGVEAVAGLEVVAAQAAALGVALTVTGRVEFNRNAMADVRSLVPGIVREVMVDLGQAVAAGDPLFALESARVGELQAHRGAARERVVAARAQLARQRELSRGAIASQRQVEVARQELEAAQAELGAIDQSLQLSGARKAGQGGRFVVHAPIGGTVIRRPAVAGAFAGDADALATLADTRVMWALLDLPEGDVVAARVGQAVEVTLDALPGRAFPGTLAWIAAEVDPRTRTVTARAEISNPDGMLRAGQFVTGAIRVEAPAAAVAVPVAAVQRVGDEAVVFVRVEPGCSSPASSGSGGRTGSVSRWRGR